VRQINCDLLRCGRHLSTESDEPQSRWQPNIQPLSSSPNGGHGQYQPCKPEERMPGLNGRSCVQQHNPNASIPRSCSLELIQPLSNFTHGFQRGKNDPCEIDFSTRYACGSGTAHSALTCSCISGRSTRKSPFVIRRSLPGTSQCRPSRLDFRLHYSKMLTTWRKLWISGHSIFSAHR
jgi:hypothetical protein